MCGIAGYYYKSGRNIGNTATILKMLEVQKHRGPDDSGIRAFSLKSQKTEEYTNREVKSFNTDFEGIVGFNRLSILDLSANGHQPMCSADEKIMLAFNGEIYNASDFRADLRAEGYQFKSNTDTEVILALYCKYGFEQMISRLNGMFAIILVDVTKQKVFIARDRFGIKPMYIYENHSMVAFSSEIKSFLPLDEFNAVLNESLLDEFLLFRSTINRTLLKDVSLLEPGTYLCYNADGSKSTSSFFSIENYNRVQSIQSFEESLYNVRDALSESVKRQLISDVKLGCQLSGGIDSSLVTYFASLKNSTQLLETISITLDDPRFNEEPYIDTVTAKLRLQSHKFKLASAYYLDNLQQATWHLESPINHPNTIGIYLLSQKAKQYVTVLLSGEGSDEVFGGYSRFPQVSYPFQPRNLWSALRKRESFSPNSYLKTANRSILSSSFFAPKLAKLLKPDFNVDQAMRFRNKIYQGFSGSTFDRQIKYEISTYLPDLLIRQDKMSMAHSIENRVPFLDNRMVDTSFLIPQKHLIPSANSVRNSKYVLKRLSAEVFGDSFAFRPKQGFGIPLREFFSDEKFKSFLMDQVLTGIKKRGLFNYDVINKSIKNISSIPSSELDALWIMVSFELWADQFKVSA